MNWKDKRLWIGIIVLVLVVFFYPKYCGNWTTTAPNTGSNYHDCTCLGIRIGEGSLGPAGGSDVYCLGIIISRSCYENIRDEEKGEYRYYRPCQEDYSGPPVCSWAPGLCDLEIGPGYYYDHKTDKCEYFPGGNGCPSPPFESLEECKSTCE